VTVSFKGKQKNCKIWGRNSFET